MQLAQLLQSKDTDAASKMLTAEPSLAWIRDDESGGYPLHIAVWHVRTCVLLLEPPSYILCIKILAVHAHTGTVQAYSQLQGHP